MGRPLTSQIAQNGAQVGLDAEEGGGGYGATGCSAAALPSAPPMPTVLSAEEVGALVRSLEPGRAPFPSEAQLRNFRAATASRLLWTADMRAVAGKVDGGLHLFREAYERQLLADPQALVAEDGPWVQAFWQPPQASAEAEQAHAAQAFAAPVIVTHHDGRSVAVSADPSCTTVGQVLQQAGQHFRQAFDPAHHSVFAIGAEQGLALGIGSFVRVTGLTQEEALNGMLGQIVGQDGSQYDVALPSSCRRLHRDNVVVHNAAVIARNTGCPAALGSMLSELGASVRLLWLQRGQPARPPAPGAMAAVRFQFGAMDLDGDGRVSAGELRNFLWNLHLADEQFDAVRKRFAVKGQRTADRAPCSQEHIEVDDLIYLLGRPHQLHPEVPVDALIYEAVVSILGRRTTAHIDKDLSMEDHGVGYGQAFAEHGCSYVVSTLLQIAVVVCLLLGLILSTPGLFIAAAFAYLVYLCQVGCCVRLTRAFANQTEGLEAVMALMDRPRHEDPVYHWSVKCYHYETRTRSERVTDSDGKTSSVVKHEKVRVDTHTACYSGRIPSTDMTAPYVPQTQAQQTQINTHLRLDFTMSNYHMMYTAWCLIHKRDEYQECTHTESLPSQATSCFAVWVPSSVPWWMRGAWYWAANVFLLSSCYRWSAQARIGTQDYTYSKLCYNIGWNALAFF